MDLAVQNGIDKKITVLYGTNDGLFLTTNEIATSGTLSSIVAGDFNNDGIVDILSLDISDNSARVWLGH